MKLPLAAALLAAAAVSLDPGGQLENFERRTLDARARHHAAPTPHTERIVILDITEESIERLRPLYGRWPWPRSLHGEVAEYLAADGAAAIGFDLLFAEPVTRRELDAEDWQALAALAPNADLAEVRAELARRIDALQPGLGDSQFAAAVARAGNVFQAAVFAPAEKTAGGGAMRDQAVLPFEDLARASRGIGHINVLPDADGGYRRFFPLLRAGDGEASRPALGLAIA
ncbi:MAG: CHASE2 domain-containing protein, partial [Candidatus Desulfobacillus denitrificans]